MLSENSFIPLPVRFFKIKQITLQNGIFKILCNKRFFSSAVISKSKPINQVNGEGWSLCLPAVLCISSCWGSCAISCLHFSFLVSASLPLPLLLCLLQRRCRDSFLLFLQAAQRVGVGLFPLPLLPTPFSVLLANSLLLLQGPDTLLLGRADQLSQLDGLDVVEGRLAGLVQHNGVEDDVKQRNSWNFLQPRGDCVVLKTQWDQGDICNLSVICSTEQL